MTPYERTAGPFRLRLNRAGAAGGALHLHADDLTGTRLHKTDIQELLSRIRVLELGYDRWGQPLQVRHGVIIFEKDRTRTRTFGQYRATPSTLTDLVALADELAGYLEARRRVCKYCGQPLEDDTSRAAHPECRRKEIARAARARRRTTNNTK